MPALALANVDLRTGEFHAITPGSTEFREYENNPEPALLGELTTRDQVFTANFSAPPWPRGGIIWSLAYTLVPALRPKPTPVIILTARTDEIAAEPYEQWGFGALTLPEFVVDVTEERRHWYEPVVAQVADLAESAFAPGVINVSPSVEYDEDLGGEFVACRIDVRGLTRQAFADAQQRFVTEVSDLLKATEAEGGPPLERFVVSAVRRE